MTKKRSKITLASQKQIQNFEAEAERVLNGVLGLEQWLITDESRLRDFSTCGLPEDAEYDSDQAAAAAWNEWVLKELQRKFKLLLPSTDVLLVDLFDMIDQRHAT